MNINDRGEITKSENQSFDRESFPRMDLVVQVLDSANETVGIQGLKRLK